MHLSYYGFIEDFHRHTKTVKSLSVSKTLYKLYKYVISLQNYLTKFSIY